MRIINSLDELDLIIKELDDAAKISDDALRALFKTFRFEDSKQVYTDPFSSEYYKHQFDIYEKISGKQYKTDICRLFY